MSKARVSSLSVTTSTAGSKARISSLSVDVPVAPGSKARVSSLSVSYSGVQSRARVSSLQVSASSVSPATRWIKRGGVLVPLGQDPTTPTFPTWGPYGELGTYKPDDITTGVPDGPALTVVTGNQILTTSGTATNPIVHFRQDYQGLVRIQGSYHTFKECMFRGPNTEQTAGVGTGCINCATASVRGVVIEDCTFLPQIMSDVVDGVYGHHFTIRRSNIRGTVDGFGVSNGANQLDVHIEGNYIHDHGYRASRTQSDGHTHNDGTQVFGGSLLRIIGNNYQSFTDTDPAVSNLANPYASTGNQNTGQSILIQGEGGNSITDVEITDNWINGAAEGGVHILNKGAALVTATAVKRNKFGRNQRPIGGVKYTVRANAASSVDIPLTGPDANVFEDTGLPVTVVRD